MASEFYVGVKIGATMLASFGSVLAGSKNTLAGLGKVTDELQAKQLRLGEALAKSTPSINLGKLRSEYETIGKAIETTAARQATLAGSVAKADALQQTRTGMLVELGKMADGLREQRLRLNAAMTQAAADPSANLGKLRAEYDQLGQRLETVTAKQETLNAQMSRADTAQQSRIKTLAGMGKTVADLKAKHTVLGNSMAHAMEQPVPATSKLGREYERLGQMMDKLRAKHAALAASLAKGAALQTARSEMKGEMVGTFATAAAVAAPVIGSVKKSANFESGLRDIAITGNLSKPEEIKLGEAVRKAALSTSQGHDAILTGVNTLVAAGMDAKKAGTYSSLLGKVATATNADMKDLAGMVFSLSETLGIKGDAALKEAFNRAAYGGKLGRFELKDMAKALPEMTAAFAAKGIKGQEALTQIIASLEVGREGAGSGEEAVTNLRNWLSHMNAKHTKEAYTKAGVDYQQSMQNLVAGGYSSYEASLEIAQKFIASRGDGFMKQWKEAGSKGDEDAQRKLMESFGLNEVFQDIQTINHLLAMRQNWDKYQNTKKQMGSQEAMGTIDVDYQKRAELANKAWERFKTRVADVGITIGNALLPTLTGLLTTLTPIIEKIGDFAAAHPGAIRAVVGFVGAVVGMKIATLALGWGLNFFVKSPLNMLSTGFTTVAGRFTYFRALVIGGGSRLTALFQLFGMGATGAGKLAAGLARLGRFIPSLRTLGSVALTVGRFLLPFGQGLLMTFGGPLLLAGRGVLFLGKLLGGVLLSGVRIAGQAVLWLGRAMLMNPIGLLITAIGIGAYLVWKHWSTVKAAVLAGWNWLKGVKDQFFNAGGELINGLVNGITSKLSAAKNAVVGFGSDIKNWFTSTLGIKSPSRVFMGFGDNIAEGAALGIGRSAALAGKAAAGMALVTTTAWGQPALQAPALGAIPATHRAAMPSPFVENQPLAQLIRPAAQKPADAEQTVWQRVKTASQNAPVPVDMPRHESLAERIKDAHATIPAAGALNAANSGANITFAPNITIQPGAPEAVQQQVNQALQLSFAEFERMMKRYEADKKRRSYGGKD